MQSHRTSGDSRSELPRQSPLHINQTTAGLPPTAAPTTAPTTPTAAAPLSSRAVFSAAFMPGIPDMPLPIPSLIRMEVVERPFSTLRHRARVAIPRVVPVINVAVKPPPAMKPGPRANEHPAVEPVRPIVPIRRAVIRRVVVVPVRARRRKSDPDLNLRRSGRVPAQKPNTQRRHCQNFPTNHR